MFGIPPASDTISGRLATANSARTADTLSAGGVVFDERVQAGVLSRGLHPVHVIRRTMRMSAVAQHQRAFGALQMALKSIQCCATAKIYCCFLTVL